MSTDWNDYAADQAAADAYEEEYEKELIEKALKELSAEKTKEYLMFYGDAIQDRFESLKGVATLLFDAGFFGSSIVASVTTVELVVRYFVLRPLCQGMFLQDQWANVLLTRVFGRSTSADRELLPKILKNWNIDLSKLLLQDGQPAWQAFNHKVRPVRNAFVHGGKNVNKKQATIALEFVGLLFDGLVKPVALNHGLDYREGGWSKSGNIEVEKGNPF